MKKTWYRVVLDVAYEGEVLDGNGEIITNKRERRREGEKVVRSTIGDALRDTPHGLVDWRIARVEPKP